MFNDIRNETIRDLKTRQFYKQCTDCKGTGYIRDNSTEFLTGLHLQWPCSQCNGIGRILNYKETEY